MLITLGLGNQAAGYTITPDPFYPSFLLETDLGGVPAQDYDVLTQYEARQVNTYGHNSATNDWSGSMSDVTDSWGPGGKTTTFTQRIDGNMQAHLTGLEAYVEGIATLNSYFTIQPEAVGASGPIPVEIEVSWSGDVSGAWPTIALYLVQGLRFTAIVPLTRISPQGTQIFQAVLPQASSAGNFYDLFFYLVDEQDWADPGNYSSNLTVEVTLSATEAGLTPPPVHTPVPAGQVLLGSGLAALAAKASYVSLKKRVSRGSAHLKDGMGAGG